MSEEDKNTRDLVWLNRSKGVSTLDGEPISMLDRGLDGLTTDELKEWIVEIFGDPDVPEHRKFYISCVAQAHSYETNHCNQDDESNENLIEMINVQNSMSLVEGFSGLNANKLKQDILLSAYAIAHVKSTAWYTEKELELCHEDFNNFMKEKLHREYTVKKGFKRINGRRIIETEVKLRETKALFRILDKMWVKPDLQFPTIKDLLGGRIFVNGRKDFDTTVAYLKNFKKPFRFKDKKENNKNRGDGFGDVAYLEALSDKNIGIEVQVIDKDLVGEGFELCEESYPFYSEVLQASLREDRKQNNEQFLREGMVSARIEEFVKRKDLNGNFTEDQARKRYWARWNASFFKHKGVFYSYQNILRLRQNELSPIHSDLLQTLFDKFNRTLGVDFSAEGWLGILSESDNDLLSSSNLETLEEYLSSIKGIPKAVLARVTLQQTNAVDAAIA